LASRYTIGLHFDTDSVRALVVDIKDGRVAGQALQGYAPHVPPHFLDASSRACRDALRIAGASPRQIIGVGVAFSIDWMPSDADSFSMAPSLAAAVREKPPGASMTPGEHAGRLSEAAATHLGLPAGIAVSAEAPDTHAAVPGAGVAAPSTLVMHLGKAPIHLLNSRVKATVPGIVGPVENGILPGYFGYEIHQPGHALTGQAEREAIEAAALDLRRQCDALREAGVPVRRFVAIDQERESSLLMQIFADVLDGKIKLAASDQPAALGAAILACIAAGTDATGYHSISQIIHAMAHQREEPVYRPDLRARKQYDKLYEAYRSARSD
jgi:ribulose kinase